MLEVCEQENEMKSPEVPMAEERFHGRIKTYNKP